MRKKVKPVSSSISRTVQAASRSDIAAPALSLVKRKPMAFSSSAPNSEICRFSLPRWRSITFQQCDGTAIGPFWLSIVRFVAKCVPVTT